MFTQLGNEWRCIPSGLFIVSSLRYFVTVASTVISWLAVSDFKINQVIFFTSVSTETT